MQRGVAKGLKVPCLFMITEVSIRCQKTRRLVYAVYPSIPPPQYTTACNVMCADVSLINYVVFRPMHYAGFTHSCNVRRFSEKETPNSLC